MWISISFSVKRLNSFGSGDQTHLKFVDSILSSYIALGVSIYHNVATNFI